MNTVMIYSKFHSPNIIGLIETFDGFDLIEVLPRHEMISSLLHSELPNILIVNTDFAEFIKLKNSFVQMKTKTLLIAQDLDSKSVFDAFRYGIHGLIDIPITPFNLYQALDNLTQGLFYLTPLGTQKLIDAFKISENDIITKKEKKILELMKEGKTYSMIAAELFVSGHTIRSHMQNIYSKLNANCKADAIQIATESRII